MPPWSFSQPERINPELNQKGYNVKSDVWSLGITMVPGLGLWAGGGQAGAHGWGAFRGLSNSSGPGESVGFTLKRAPNDGIMKGCPR